MAAFPVRFWRQILSVFLLMLSMFAHGTAAEMEEGVVLKGRKAKNLLKKEWMQAAHARIDDVFAGMHKVSAREFQSQPFFKALAPYKMPELGLKPYWAAQPSDLGKTLVGNRRLADFLRWEIKVQALAQGDQPRKVFFFLLDPAVIHRLLDLGIALHAQGHDPSRIHINSSYRSPYHNEAIRGALHSRHMHGEAIDLQIGDINHDGEANPADKRIVLDLLENHILKGKGGIGKYPGSQVVHMDTRPWMARWGTYKRGK